MADKVLLLGGYGVFGGKLAKRLVRESSAEIIVAGRSLAKAEAHCWTFGGTPLQLDRDGDLDTGLASIKPAIVIDAAGPFQAYGDDPYRVVRAAIAADAHYLDLADDADFVAGITTMNEAARAADVVAISGASSVPAISSAALDELTQGMQQVSLVGSVILPGNRAPRGLSVVRAIVGQAGRSLKCWRGGAWQSEPGWGDLQRVALSIDGIDQVRNRLASRIGVPDLLLFPDRYQARSVEFRAGLDLKLMHVGLWLLAWPVRLGLVRSLLPLAAPLKWIADQLEHFGSDRGGMLTYAVGRDAEGRAVERRWTLIAEAGDGPEIPPTPALILALKLLGKEKMKPGARPAIGVLTLADVSQGLSMFRIRAARTEIAASPLMQRVLADDFDALPPAWRRLAEIHDLDHFEGMASVERGSGLASRAIARLFGFPPAADAVVVKVCKHKTRHGETWTRSFADRKFVSHLSRRPDDGPGILRERFGPFSFVMRLNAEAGRVSWPVTDWKLLGIPMPNALRPESDTTEDTDAQGRFQFDVSISLPLVGRLVRYRGWLKPANEKQT